MQFFVSSLQPWGGEYWSALRELADSWREAEKGPSGIDGSTESTGPELPSNNYSKDVKENHTATERTASKYQESFYWQYRVP